VVRITTSLCLPSTPARMRGSSWPPMLKGCCPRQVHNRKHFGWVVDASLSLALQSRVELGEEYFFFINQGKRSGRMARDCM
jgi:hypothetical protein